MPAVRRARDGVSGDQAGLTPGDEPAAPGGPAGLRHRLRSMSPAGLAILTATVLALALRLFLVTRPGFLTSGTVEYDDGVYLGAALRRLEGEGQQCQSSGDTAVMLRALGLHGPEAVSWLRGMFAFAS